ncbi:hypothetical protein ACVWXL_005773 [Bradyrhizobium sp. GM22.5]
MLARGCECGLVRIASGLEQSSEAHLGLTASRLDLAVRDHRGAIAHRVDAARLEQRRILQWEYHSGCIEIAYREQSGGPIVSLVTRVNLIPMRFEQQRYGRDTCNKSSKISVQDLQSRLQNKQPYIAGALQEGLNQLTLAFQVDRRAVKRLAVLRRKKGCW